MKVNSNRLIPEFSPVEVVITLETEEELEVFKETMGMDSTVSCTAYEAGCKRQKLLQKILGNVYSHLNTTYYR